MADNLFIDVREPNEFRAGHIEGAINLPPSEIMNGAKQLKDIAKDTPLILYCRSGSRSNASIQILKSLGYTNLANGINADYVAKNYLNK